MTKKSIGISIIMIIIGGIISFLLFNTPTPDINPLQSEIDRVQKRADSLQILNNQLKIKVDLAISKADSFEAIASTTKEKIVYLKTKADDKIKSIDNYTSNELDSFFTNTRIPKAN